MTTIENPLVYVTDRSSPRKPDRVIANGKQFITMVDDGENIRIPWHRIEKIVSNHEE
jgi:uncharacterized protein (UPF0248 family)